MAIDYDIKSQKLARELYDAAMRGTISFMSAWYSLPGPAPIVYENKIAHWVVYNVEYKYLTNKEASYLKQKEEEEYKEKCMERDREVEILHHKDNFYEKEMMDRLSQVMELYEGLENYLNKARQKIDKLRSDLEQHEEAYARTEKVYLNTKKEKEEIESSLKTYISNTEVRHANALDIIYIDIREHNRLRAEAMDRQKQEGMIYEKLKQLD